MHDLGTAPAPSSFDISVLCIALEDFVKAPKANNLPKWKKSQISSQAVITKEKLENREKDFCARDVQAMLAATVFMLDKLDKIEDPDKDIKRLIYACERNLNFCEDFFDRIPM